MKTIEEVKKCIFKQEKETLEIFKNNSYATNVLSVFCYRLIEDFERVLAEEREADAGEDYES